LEAARVLEAVRVLEVLEVLEVLSLPARQPIEHSVRG
jgi:hypothetical protein